MTSFLTDIVHIQAPFNMIVLVVLFSSLASIVNTVVKQIRRYASHRHELDLKRELLDRGMGVDELERVIRASSGSSASATAGSSSRIVAQAFAPEL